MFRLRRTDSRFFHYRIFGGAIFGGAVVAMFFFCCVLSTSQHAKAAVDAASVTRSIDRGVSFLRKAQNDDGSWNGFSDYSCGLSSLCTLSLLNAGVPRDDPAITHAMRYLRACTPEQTYSVSLQTLVYCYVRSAGDLPRIRNNVQWLTRNQNPNGSWGYGTKRQSGGDPSNAQFALLALGAAQDRGIQVDPKAFEKTIAYWTDRQRGDGGWAYSKRSSGSMTCAGVASLIIANGRLGESSSNVENGQVQCCGMDSAKDDPIAQGLDWLARHFTVKNNPGHELESYFYYMYAIERTGRLSGRRFFGEHDWYREGAEELISLQDEFQGSWGGTDGEPREVATSFALLFLSKGKRQVVIGQLDHGGQNGKESNERSWQPHPDSLRQLVRHVERSWERDLTWQTVHSEKATVSDLLQAPVLVISGKTQLGFTPQQSDLLKEYIDQGGTILFDSSGGSGCGSAAGFQQSVTELCAKWYPSAPLERLPSTHPVWNAERKVDVTAMPDDFWVYGVQACCRTAVFFVPESLTCRWELGDRLFRRSNPDADDQSARDQIEQSIRIGQNIIAYATGRELKDKLDAQIVLKADASSPTERGTMRVARLDVGAGGEDARRALPNVATIIRRQAEVPVAVPEETVGFNEDDLAEVSVLWIHGRRAFVLTSAQRKQLALFLQRGGVIFGSAICGDDSFAKSFRQQIGDVLVGSKLKTMPADHPMLKRDYGGADIRSVTIRRPARRGGGEVRRQNSPPMLEYAELDEVVAVVFSPLDVACALESQNSVQCPGYSTEDAAKIVINVIQMALNQ